MPFKVGYIHPQRILVIYMYGTLKLETFADIGQRVFAAMDEADEGVGKIHTLTLIDDKIVYPKNPQAIIDMVKRVTKTGAHPKTGWVITVTDSAIQRFVGSLTAQLFVGSVRYGSTSTLPEALNYLKSRDASLADLDIDAACASFEALRAGLESEKTPHS